MVYQDQIDANLLQLFVHPKKSKCFFIIFVFIFMANIATEHKQAYW